MISAHRTLVLALALACACACGDDTIPLPTVVASSKYIEFSSWEDSSALCMDDALARGDRFVVDTAAFLGLSPPEEKIRYVWVPLPVVPGAPGLSDDWSKWGCANDEAGCYLRDSQLTAGIVFAKVDDQFHELTHAVDLAANTGGHFVFVEGLAEYLGSYASTQANWVEFPTTFRDLVAAGSVPKNYRPLLHFVGSVIERHGMAKLKELRIRVPSQATLDEFAAAYKAVLGEPLDVGLAAMTEIAIRGRLPFPGCDEAEPLEWTAPGLIDTTLRGECGDGWLIGPGAGPFRKYYSVEVAEPGDHELVIRGTGEETGELSAILDPCPGVGGYGPVSIKGTPGSGKLEAGRHVLRVWFPPNDEAKVNAALTLRNKDLPANP